MPKFKKGDRVRLTEGEHKGETGTVDEDESVVPWINFDDGQRDAVPVHALDPIEELTEDETEIKTTDPHKPTPEGPTLTPQELIELGKNFSAQELIDLRREGLL